MADSAQPRPVESSFYWAMRLMRREQREAMFAVYRYCRGLDDIADGPGAAPEKLARLNQWRQAVDRLFRNEDPLIAEVRAIAAPVRSFGLERDALEAVIRGMEMDVQGEMRAPPLDTLQAYSFCVAGAVGLLALRIFGAQGNNSRQFARAVGDALQMTNILRDIEEDAALGRLYLPREFLLQARIAHDDPHLVLQEPGLPRACELLAELAAQRYRDALAALPPDPRPLRPALIMMGVYGRILGRLRRIGWRRCGQVARVPKVERIWIALRYVGPPFTWPSSI